jgi:cyclin A
MDMLRQHDVSYPFPYTPDVYAYLRELQFRDLFPLEECSTYLVSRPDGIRADMRALLVEWMVAVCEDFRISSDVFHLSVATVDRALRILSLPPNQIQLLGCAAMLLASKFENVFIVNVEDLVYMTDNTYTRAQILDMETRVLTALDFRLVAATPKPFLRRFQQAGKVVPTEKFLSNYACELALTSTFFVRFTPSLLAAACVYYACLAHGKTWSGDLVHYSGYEADELGFMLNELGQMMQRAARRENMAHWGSIITKYNAHHFGAVSTLPPLERWPAVVPGQAIRSGGR